MSTQYKDFTVIHSWSGWQATLRIEQDAATQETMRDMLLAWGNHGKQRIAAANGDITAAWLLLFAEYALPESRGKPLKDMFERTAGWAPLDGSCGIELLRADLFDVHANEFTIVPREARNV